MESEGILPLRPLGGQTVGFGLKLACRTWLGQCVRGGFWGGLQEIALLHLWQGLLWGRS